MNLTKEQFDDLMRDGIYDDGEVFLIKGDICLIRELAVDQVMSDLTEYWWFIPNLTQLTKEVVSLLLNTDHEVLKNQLNALDIEDKGWFLDTQDELASFYGYEKMDTIVANYGEEQLVIGVFE